MQKKIYIAGQVKGLPLDQVKEAFAKRQLELEAQGYEVINPIEHMEFRNAARIANGKAPLSDSDPEDRKVILKISIGLMLEADEIDLLFNWQNSEFAVKERNVAQEIGMPINYPG